MGKILSFIKNQKVFSFFIFCIILFFAILHISSLQSKNNEIVFGNLSYIADFSNQFILENFIFHARDCLTNFIMILSGACGILIIYILVLKIFKKDFHISTKAFIFFLLGILFACLGEVFFINIENNDSVFKISETWLQQYNFLSTILVGSVLYAISFIFFLFSKNVDNFPSQNNDVCCCGSNSKCKCLNFAFDFFVFLLLGFNIFTRFYALNAYPGYYEGELSPYHLGATSIIGAYRANYSFEGPFAPLGLMFYVPIYICVKFIGPCILALRASSVLIYIITCFSLYIVAKALTNKYVALLSIAFMTFEELQLGWSRTDFHPHGVTSWMSLLIIYCCYKFLKEEKKKYIFPLLVLMFVSWQQYPSGQFASLIPFAMVCFYLLKKLFIKEKFPKGFKSFSVIAIVGILFWILNLYIYSYIATGSWTTSVYPTRLGPRMSLNDLIKEEGLFYAIFDTIKLSFLSFLEIVHGFYIKQKEVFFQDLFQPIGDLNVRAVSWFTLISFTAGFMIFLLKFFSLESIIIFSYIIVSLFSGILSDHIYVKRYSTLFPMVYLISSYAIYVFVRNLSYVVNKKIVFLGTVILSLASLLFVFCVSNHIWFTRNAEKMGIASEEVMKFGLKKELAGKTLLVICCSSHYSAGRNMYLWSDEIRDGKMVVSFDDKCPNSPDANEMKIFLNQQLNMGLQNALVRWAGGKSDVKNLNDLDNVVLQYEIFKEDYQEQENDINKLAQDFSHGEIFYNTQKENYQMGVANIIVDKEYWKE